MFNIMKRIKSKKYIFLDHTADIKFRAFGKSLEEAFVNSAKATFKFTTDEKIRLKIKKTVKTKGKDFESLLYNFLEELLFLFDSENFILSKIKNIKIDKKKFSLTAEILGDKTDNYQMHLHIKAVTYNDMFIKKEGERWIVQVVLDI